MSSLEAISPIDGRYREMCEPLAAFFSVHGLTRYRVTVEVEYLIALSETLDRVRDFTGEEKLLLRDLVEHFSVTDTEIVNAIDLKGYKNIKATDHDVKAVEYFLKDRLGETSLSDALEWIHFALTSEDVNTVSYGLMLRDGLEQVLLPTLDGVLGEITKLSEVHKDLSMLARTHGQPASPTTFGKEMANFAARLFHQISMLRALRIPVKLNGATGNYNAHIAAFPDVDWPAFTIAFVARFNAGHDLHLRPNLLTTQIEPHDGMAELFDILRRINVILIGFDQDIWRYISDGWLVQRAVEGEVGSSTMPHKINPWKFENSEGNLGLANALLGFFSTKLPVSRLQRDLSDSTVERSFGTAFAHCLLGYLHLLKGLSRVGVDPKKITEELQAQPQVIAEGIQTILRREGVPMPYEQLKALTRGKQVTLEDLHEFIRDLPVSEAVKEELLALTPENYIGLAAKLAQRKEEFGI